MFFRRVIGVLLGGVALVGRLVVLPFFFCSSWFLEPLNPLCAKACWPETNRSTRLSNSLSMVWKTHGSPRSKENTYWITYVAVSWHGAAMALASTNDFETFERHGLIFCPENKDVVLFPRKVSGQYVSLHRPNPNSHFGRPQIWIARSPNLLYWGQHECLYSGCADWESDRVGAGVSPIALEEGWLEIYHGSRRSTCANEVGAYSAGAMLMDRNDSTHILKRSRGPIMQPSTNFEQQGFVPNVVFPTALIECKDSLTMYYGAADTCIGVVEFSRHELLEALH